MKPMLLFLDCHLDIDKLPHKVPEYNEKSDIFSNKL